MKLLRRIASSVSGRYRRWTFKPYVIRRQFAGEDLHFYIGDLFGQASYGPNHSHWPELDWIKAYGIRPGDTVVDCGANHGFSTILFAKWAGARGKVHAFEPFSHNVQILRENLRLNNVENVVCHPAAVGAKPGSVTISAQPNASVISKSNHAGAVEDVFVVTLDDSLSDQPVAFMKIDVEGFEFEVLQGARRVLASLPRLDLELHVAFYENKEKELREILELVPLDRYNIHIQLEVDGPIVAFDRGRHTEQVLSRCEVVHLLCC